MGCGFSNVKPEKTPTSAENSAPVKVKTPGAGTTNNNPINSPSKLDFSSSAVMPRVKALSKLNSKIDKDLSKMHTQNIQRALLLGTGESGKSTIFKQMRLCYGNSYTDFERTQYAKIIWIDTLRTLRLLMEICLTEFRSPNGDPKLTEVISSWIGPTAEPEVRRAAIFLQSIDLTRTNFLRMEDDPTSKAFLHNHIDASEPSGDFLLKQKIDIIEAQGKLYESQPLLSTVLRGGVISNEIKLFTLGPKTLMDDLTVSPSNRDSASEETGLDTPAGNESLASHSNSVTDAETRAELTSLLCQTSDLSDVRIKDAATILWTKCPKVIRQLLVANQLGLETNAVYFLDNFAPRYRRDCKASDDDIVHARVKTTGITTTTFNIKGRSLIVSDVGGQRVERKKWIHSFDDVTCVLFVASVSEYDQVLDEDSRVNRLDEALEVFYQAVNSKWFRAKSVQLFLNKTDILEKKCQHSSFKRHFEKFKGDERNPTEIMNFIEKEFMKRFRADGRGLYAHRVSATDTTAMKFVIDASSDMILMENMKWAGMI